MSDKSDQKSNVLKSQALRLAKSGEIFEALLKVNKCLCLAGSQKLYGELYAIRAELYAQLNFHQKCFKNVNLARKYNYDDAKRLKELEQLSMSQSLEKTHLTAADDPWEFFKLAHPSNPKLPYVIESLEVKCDKKFGRMIVAKEDLSVGDVIAIERPFLKILKHDPDDVEYPQTNIYHYCANCLDDNLLDLIPCRYCISTMFCSQKCMDEANETFHRYECEILTKLQAYGGWRMALRSFFDALSICDGSIGELEKIARECDKLKWTVYNFDLSNVTDVDYNKNRLKCLLSLFSGVEVEDKDFKVLFTSHPLLRKMWMTHSTFIKNIITRFMQIEILNFHSIKGSSLCMKKSYRAALGDGAFIFCSLVNHSCMPNVMRVVVDGRMVMIVERPIRQGEQLFDCYIG